MWRKAVRQNIVSRLSFHVSNTRRGLGRIRWEGILNSRLLLGVHTNLLFHMPSTFIGSYWSEWEEVGNTAGFAVKQYSARNFPVRNHVWSLAVTKIQRLVDCQQYEDICWHTLQLIAAQSPPLLYAYFHMSGQQHDVIVFATTRKLSWATLWSPYAPAKGRVGWKFVRSCRNNMPSSFFASYSSETFPLVFRLTLSLERRVSAS